jgi:tetratricopeptide (TPR) repeat protein
MLASLLLLAAFLIAPAQTTPSPAQKPAAPASAKAGEQTSARSATQWNNLGVAYMDRQSLDEAVQAFEKAHGADPKVPTPELNLAIALLNEQKNEQARDILERLSKQQSNDPHVWFNLGLLYRNQGERAPALQAFEKAAALAPNDAITQYFIGDLNNQAQQYDAAIAAFTRALQNDPFAVSAEFGMARAYQRKGNADEARTHLQRFQKITREKLGSPISPIYGEQGPLSLAQRMEGEPVVAVAIPVKFELVGQAGLPTAVLSKTGNSDAPGTGVCVFDFDGDGRPDIFLADNHGTGPALFHNVGNGKFEDVTQRAGLATKQRAISCGAGDYDNDGKPDLAITFADQVALFHNEGATFKDVTAATKIANPNPFSATLVDYDHDGDLDLYVTSSKGAAHLWRNNADGTFTDVSADTALSVNAVTMIASDINNDRAIDLVTTSGAGAPTIHFNPREGQFPSATPWDPKLSSALAATTIDFDKDGWMDLAFTHPDAPGLTLWHNEKGKSFKRIDLPGSSNWKRGWGLAAFDYDNDGWVDLAAIVEGANGTELHLFRNRGPQGFEDVTANVGLDKVQLKNARALVAFDFDGAGANDLLVTGVDGFATLLRNVGATKNHSMRVSLRGLNDNKSAFGTKVEIFAGEQRQKYEIAGSSGYLSQGPTEVVAGLGTQSQADVVRLLWPTGVVQDELELAASKPQSIMEIDRRGSSCPVLFAWNGNRYQLITDVIGPAVIGHWVAPHQTDVADPDEYVKVSGAIAHTRDGYLSFRFAEPMEEVNYLDQARLVAVDHPSHTTVFPNERFVSNPPFPEAKVISSAGAHPPAGAWDDKHHDVLPKLLRADHEYVRGFELMKFAGFAQPHTLELDLGAWVPQRPLRLLMHGFTEYFTANSMYAAYQSGVQVAAPYVEAFEGGKWVKVVDDLGFPAGLPRTMVADLTGKLKPGTRRIRIVTNLQIYWDQVLIDQSPETLPNEVHEVPLAHARLHFHGYPRSVERYIAGDLDYIYEQVSATGPYARHVGTYTEYGDVTPLLKAVDDKYVIFGSGEEVMLDFDPSTLPKLPVGWTRDYFFYANGFVKDMDFYEADGNTVDRMPFHGMKTYPYPDTQHYPDDADLLDYQIGYNTRYQTGNGVTSFRYEWDKHK